MQERKKLRKSGRAGRTWRAALPDAQGIARKDWADGRERGRAPFRLAWSEGCAVRVCLVFAAGVIALTAFATWAFALDRQALWSVVNACVADHKLTRAPFPCLKVDLGGGKERGYVVLYAPFERDTILAPTRKIVGVEDPYLQSSAAPNYFADAWEAWLNLNGERGRSPDLGFALVVNSALARSQDQLHIHMGCLAPSARSALDAAAPRLAIGEWSPIGPLVPHQPFWAFRTGTADLGRLDPFRLAAEGFADKVRNLALLTVVVASARIAGADEFVVLASYAGAPHAWWPVGADNLLLARCPSGPRPYLSQ
jgi:CDP-diacylglycerol pyrophosphatase